MRTRLSKKAVAAMDRKDAIAWVRSVCTDQLRAIQAKTLSVLVGAMLSVRRVSLANVGRSMAGEALVKHRIKRAYRFIANERVEISDAMRQRGSTFRASGGKHYWRRESRRRSICSQARQSSSRL